LSKQTALSREKIFRMDEGLALKEALLHANSLRMQNGMAYNPTLPIRMIPFQAFFDKTHAHPMEADKVNPDLPRILHERFGVHIGDYSKNQETVQIPSTVVNLKIADMVIEGAEPYSQWKEYVRVVDMPTPLFNVPTDKYSDWLGFDNFDRFKATAGDPVDMGGKTSSVALNCENDNGYYRAKLGIKRNDIRDNKFLAVEQNLKNAGAVWYYGLGKKIIDTYIANAVHTDTRANLDLSTSVHSQLEALVNVIRNQFPGTLLNRADTAFFHPSNAYETVVTSTGASGIYPFLDNRMLAPQDQDVINNSGLSKALGLKRSWETPQATDNTVVIVKRDISHVFGLYQDLEIEDFDMTVSGITESALSMRFDLQKAHDEGLYTITSF